jgi:hypothetical protein
LPLRAPANRYTRARHARERERERERERASERARGCASAARERGASGGVSRCYFIRGLSSCGRTEKGSDREKERASERERERERERLEPSVGGETRGEGEEGGGAPGTNAGGACAAN